MSREQIRIGVTGGAGFIGSHICRYLADLGHEVYAYDPLSHYVDDAASSTIYENIRYRRLTLLSGATLIRGTTCNKFQTTRFLEDAKPSIVIHCGGWPMASKAHQQIEPIFQEIGSGTINLLEALPPEVTRFIFISSSMVYGDFEQVPMTESGRTEPTNFYGAMKLAGEYMTKTVCSMKGIEYFVVRPTAVYGPGDNNQRVVQKFVDSAIRNETLHAVNPSETWLDFSFVTDVAKGIAQAALAPGPGNEVVNISRGEARTLEELLAILRGHFPLLEVVEQSEAWDQKPKRGALDISKARRLFQYQPSVGLEAGISQCIDYARSQHERIESRVPDLVRV